jgi:Fe-S-cluster-containing hydrogenase component 2
MLSFSVDQQKCIRCGQCVQDCLLRIIEMDDGYPTSFQKKEGSCLECQHCLAGSVRPGRCMSILGK